MRIINIVLVCTAFHKPYLQTSKVSSISSALYSLIATNGGGKGLFGFIVFIFECHLSAANLRLYGV